MEKWISIWSLKKMLDEFLVFFLWCPELENKILRVLCIIITNRVLATIWQKYSLKKKQKIARLNCWK